VSENSGAEAGRLVGLGQLIGGLVVTLVSLGLLLGAFLLSQAGVPAVPATPTAAGAAARPTATPFLPTLVSPSPTSTPTSTPSSLPTEEIPSPTTPTLSATPIATAAPTQANRLLPSCPRPAGWSLYTVRRGDTLPALAWRSGMTTYALMQANCLSSQVISAGQRLYVPPTFYATATPKPYQCGPPLSWTYLYRVQAGDTLYGLSRRFGVGIEAIRRANCLGGYQINIGQVLYMPQPPLYTSTPRPTATSTPVPTSTPTPVPSPTLTPTAVPTVIPTGSPAPTATFTPVPTVIPTTPVTPTVTFTPVPTVVFTETPTLAPTLTPTPVAPTATFTPAPTSTPTFTPEPATATFTPAPPPPTVPTETPAPTETPTP
jgi:LysM repeat protein